MADRGERDAQPYLAIARRYSFAPSANDALITAARAVAGGALSFAATPLVCCPQGHDAQNALPWGSPGVAGAFADAFAGAFVDATLVKSAQ